LIAWQQGASYQWKSLNFASLVAAALENTFTIVSDKELLRLKPDLEEI
jgi:hypothetical protein